MFLTVVLIAVVIGILFIVVAVSLIGFIYHSIKKNALGKKKSIKVLIPSAIVWVLLIAANTVLIVNFIYKNRHQILDQSVRIPAEMAGKGLALTFQSFEKNWDQNRLLQLQSLSVHPSTMSYEIKDNKRVYEIELILDNQSPADTKLYLDDLIGNHYLVVCDKDDFVYLLKVSDRLTSWLETEKMTEKTDDGVTNRTTERSIEVGNTKIPFGKSKFGFTTSVPEDVDITHARFVNDVIKLK